MIKTPTPNYDSRHFAFPQRHFPKKRDLPVKTEISFAVENGNFVARYPHTYDNSIPPTIKSFIVTLGDKWRFNPSTNEISLKLEGTEEGDLPIHVWMKKYTITFKKLANGDIKHSVLDKSYGIIPPYKPTNKISTTLFLKVR